MNDSQSLTYEQMQDNKIKNKVREIQHNYCGESVETKLYFAIKQTIDEFCVNHAGGEE